MRAVRSGNFRPLQAVEASRRHAVCRESAGVSEEAGEGFLAPAPRLRMQLVTRAGLPSGAAQQAAPWLLGREAAVRSIPAPALKKHLSTEPNGSDNAFIEIYFNSTVCNGWFVSAFP